jgi:hypothetical protein
MASSTQFGFALLGLLALGCSSDTTAPAAAPGNGKSDASSQGGTGGVDASSGSGGDASGGTSGAGGAGTGGATFDAAPLVPTDGGSYADESLWICLPGSSHDVCHENLDATSIATDGTMTVEPHVFATNPPVDCFYVYPTISLDAKPNSDFNPGQGEEIAFAKQQAARLSSVCNVYAPIYRQVTLPVLAGTVPGTAADREAPYGDALNAWNYFQSQYSKGRPFVLIGHSQGTGILSRLVREHIDNDPAMRARLVSAYLIGGNVAVPDGQDVGADFKNIPLCRTDTQRGCIVAYSTFRATEPPPAAGALFGRPRSGTGVAACNNPAVLAGGQVALKPYWPSTGSLLDLGSLQVTTPYVTLPDFLRGECVVKDGYSYMEITILGVPSDPRPDNIGGNLAPTWGLHLVDVHLAMGDIVDLVKTQVAALPDN